MSNNTDFKELWKKQEAVIPDTKEIFEKARKFKRNNLKKIVLANVLLLLTAAYIANLWYHNTPQFISTGIGSTLVILAIIIFLCVYNQLIPLLINENYETDSSSYLQQLLKINAKQSFLHKTMLNIYFILLSSGVFIYMIEPTSHMSFSWALFSYAITVAWIAFAWVFLRPRAIKKYEIKFNELIGRFEELNRQLATGQ